MEFDNLSAGVTLITLHVRGAWPSIAEALIPCKALDKLGGAKACACPWHELEA